MRARGAKEQGSEGTSDELGFVVIGRNEGDRLIRSITTAAHHSGQIVYVDSASADGSAKRARQLGVAVVELDHSAPFTAGRARRAGMAELLRLRPDCRHVQFIDGDCILAEDWVPGALAFLKTHQDAAVVCGRRFEADPSASFYNRMIDEEWNTPCGQTEACGGDAMMRVSALRQVGGFRAELKAGEEPELCFRLRQAGWTIWRIDRRMTEHDARLLRFRQYWLRALRGGFGYAQAWSMTRASETPLFRHQLRSAFIWVLAVPLLGIGAAVIALSGWPLLAIPLAWGVQIARIAGQRERARPGRWRAASLLMLAKVPELLGAAHYFFQRGGDSFADYKAVA